MKSKKPTKGGAARDAAGKADSPAAPKPKRGAPDAGAFPIVALGASAGGLEALELFFAAVPCDPAVAFVVLTHLDPGHVSLLPEIIQRSTNLSVTTALDGVRVVPNHVYVLPPNAELHIEGRVLQLKDLDRARPHRPIDTFFQSLAEDQGRLATCIVLSGTGSDGSLGLQSVRSHGGLTMAEDSASARYDGMPSSAVATGMVDHVLPPSEMPATLLQYAASLTGDSDAAPGSEDEIVRVLPQVCRILRDRTGHDFSLYKTNTICRRIARRMTTHQLDSAQDYVRYLLENEREANVLFKELLIGVTRFFRDAGAFAHLEEQVLPEILAGKPDGYTVRVWIAGCSTGEEAYSIAMALREAIDAQPRRINAQIFATDIDVDAIEVARAGLYPEAAASAVGTSRLQRHFDPCDGGQCRIRKTIRDMLVFAPQNLIKDPPFTKLDLLCCRNVLIYLGAELQQSLLPMFRYSLRPGGVLLLGTSESIGQASHLFTAIDRRWKTFRRGEGAAVGLGALAFPMRKPAHDQPRAARPALVEEAEDVSAFQLVETILRQSGAPPCVIIDDSGQVLYIHGRTGRFLEPAEGRATHAILEMVRPALRAELSGAIHRASTSGMEVVRPGLRAPSLENDSNMRLKLTVRPLKEPTALQGLLLIAFEEAADGRVSEARATGGAGQRGKSRVTLEAELRRTREDLQTTIEELETSSEEMRSTNEELQSTNEELQSTNEELETSKEELQSLNEESTTVNAELQSRIDELSRANDDLKNLLDSTDVASIFLDGDLRIRRYTPRATAILPLAPGDLGRPLSHFASLLVDVNLQERAASVVDDLVVREDEVHDAQGRYYTMRVRPYRTVNNVIDGVVMTFEDITSRRQAEGALRESELLHRTFTESFPGTACLIAMKQAPLPSQLLGRDFAELTGYDAADFLAGTVLLQDLVVAEDAERRKQGLAQWMESASRQPPRGAAVLFDHAYGLRHRDGSIRQIREIDALATTGGEPGYWCILLDLGPMPASN